MKTLDDMVQDWGGFERLIAELHDTGSVTVEHNVTLPGRSGASRQIDVLVRHQEGLYEHLIVVECKYRKRAVSRTNVDEVAATVREVGASRGVIFTTKGFQRGAITQAEHDGVELFRIREPTDAEWGSPGRHFDLWLQVLSIGLGDLALPGSTVIGEPPADNCLDLAIGFDGPGTPIEVKGLNDRTLEGLVERIARETARFVYQAQRFDFGSGQYVGTHRIRFRVNFKPPTPILCPRGRGVLQFPSAEFDVGVRIDQSRIETDRAANYAFVLAIEDCVNKVVRTASRDSAGGKTSIQTARIDAPAGDAYVNGSIAQLWTTGFADFAQFADTPRGEGSGRQMALRSDPAMSSPARGNSALPYAPRSPRIAG